MATFSREISFNGVVCACTGHLQDWEFQWVHSASRCNFSITGSAADEEGTCTVPKFKPQSHPWCLQKPAKHSVIFITSLFWSVLDPAPNEGFEQCLFKKQTHWKPQMMLV